METVLLSPMEIDYEFCSLDFNTWLFQILPAELTLLVFSYLDTSSLQSITKVNKTWNKYTIQLKCTNNPRFSAQHEAILWKELCLALWPNLKKCVQYFTESASIHYNVDYKTFFLKR